MKKLIIAGGIVFSLGMLTGEIEARQVLDRIVAVVNDDIITQSELDQVMSPIYNHYKESFTGDEFYAKLNQARRNLLQQLIEDRLVYQEAMRLGVKISESEVGARYRDFRSRFSEEQFQDLLVKQGLTIEKIKDRYREQLAIRALHRFQVQSRVVVTPKDIESYYNDNIHEFTVPAKVKARTITIRKNEEAMKNKEEDLVAQAKAEEILRQLYAGEEFEDLARKFSQDTKAESGGDLGYVARGSLVAVIDNVLFDLKKDEVSPILETEMGYHLFRVEDIASEEITPLDDMRDAIKDFLFRKKSDERFEKWIDDLKRDAYISIR